MSQFGVSYRVVGTFFDKPKVLRVTRAKDRRALSQAGAHIRQTARNSIKSRRFGLISKPGNPPFDHVGYARSQRNRVLKKQGLPPKPKPKALDARGLRVILFGYDPQNKSVVIGPLRFGGQKGQSTLPQALEFGGQSVNYKGKTITIRARPFMRPALARELPQLPKRWASSVST